MSYPPKRARLNRYGQIIERIFFSHYEQDLAVCATKFPSLICRPIGAQFMADHLIALFEFEEESDGIVLSSERHYRLVPPDEVSSSDLELYRTRPV